MFQESAALLINKIDLMSYVDFDLEKAKRDAPFPAQGFKNI